MPVRKGAPSSKYCHSYWLSRHTTRYLVRGLAVAGAVAYLTVFTDRYRRELLQRWKAALQASGVPHNPSCSPVTTLGDPVAVRLWQVRVDAVLLTLVLAVLAPAELQPGPSLPAGGRAAPGRAVHRERRAGRALQAVAPLH